MLRINQKRIIPAPFVTIGKQFTFTPDGQPLNSRYTINLNGTLLPNKGSPLSTGWYTGSGDPGSEPFTTDDDKHDSILRKQKLLREEFSRPQLLFEYWGASGDPVYCNPKVTNFDFPQGIWVTLGTYSITMESPILNLLTATGIEDSYITGASGLYLTSASDDVQINERDDGTGIYEIARSVSAQGVSYASGCPNSTEPWKNAKAWVNYRLTNFPFPSGDSRFNLTSSTGWYNLVQNEDINRYNGTYAVNQRYLYHTNNYTENRSVSRTVEPPRNADGGPTLTTISVQGVIQGLDANNVAANKLTNARAYFNAITGSIGATVGAYGRAVNTNYVEENNQGQIQYSFQFINATGSTYTHNYDVNFSFAQGNPQVTIQGNLEGISEDTFFNTPAGYTKFNRAASGWVNIKDTLKTLAFAQNAMFGGPLYATGFSDMPIAKQVSYNEVIGTVQYQYTFGWKGGSADAKYNEEYEIQFSTNNSDYNVTLGGIQVQGTINGKIIGLANSGSPDDPSSKYSNAKYGFLQVTGALFNRVNSEATNIGGISYPLSAKPSSRTIGMDSTNGIISYSYTFNNSPPTSHALVAAEDIQIQDNYGGQIIAIQGIPGRAAGPILQNIGTRSEKRRSINLVWSLYPTGNTYWTFGDKGTIANLASGVMDNYLPTSSTWYLIGDNDSWDWRSGTYQRNMEILYI